MSMEDETHPVTCFLNGKILPFAEAKLPVFDLAVMQGATVTERLRTFAHQPYDVCEHLDRLRTSLDLVKWKHLPDLTNLANVIADVTQRNCQTISAQEDLSIVVFVTAGQALGDANGLIQASTPTVCVYTAPLPLANWATSYQQGVDLIVPEIRQISIRSLDPQIKMRSRLHWQMADQEAREQNPRALAVLLDENGFLTETSSGNLLMVKNGCVQTPRKEVTLNGIARGHVVELCAELGIPVQFTDLSVSSVADADEAFLTSSTYCILPVATLNGQRIGTSRDADHACGPGPITQQLIRAWANLIGTNFVEQALAAAVSARRQQN